MEAITPTRPTPPVDDRRSILKRRAAVFGPIAFASFLAGRLTSSGDLEAAAVAEVGALAADALDHWSRRVPAWREARVVLVDRPTVTPCGLAGVGGPGYCARDARVYLDLAFLEPLTPGGRALVIGHEVGHHVQAVLGRVEGDRVAVELGADCLAGAWIVRDRPELAVEAVDLAATVGDEWHGSGSERAGAFTAGVAGRPCP